jgi:hypothetical protein
MDNLFYLLFTSCHLLFITVPASAHDCGHTHYNPSACTLASVSCMRPHHSCVTLYHRAPPQRKAINKIIDLEALFPYRGQTSPLR